MAGAGGVARLRPAAVGHMPHMAWGGLGSSGSDMTGPGCVGMPPILPPSPPSPLPPQKSGQWSASEGHEVIDDAMGPSPAYTSVQTVVLVDKARPLG